MPTREHYTKLVKYPGDLKLASGEEQQAKDEIPTINETVANEVESPKPNRYGRVMKPVRLSY